MVYNVKYNEVRLEKQHSDFMVWIVGEQYYIS